MPTDEMADRERERERERERAIRAWATLNGGVPMNSDEKKNTEERGELRTEIGRWKIIS